MLLNNQDKKLIAALHTVQAAAQGSGPVAKLRGQWGKLRHMLWTVISGSDISRDAQIAGSVRFPHLNGVVIHQDAVVGENCLIMQQVTLGQRAKGGAPHLEEDVYAGAGAKILGPVRIGAGSCRGHGRGRACAYFGGQRSRTGHSMMRCDIGVFAHNEETCIAAFIDSLMAQSLFADPQCDVQVYILANGCTDGTVAAAQAACMAGPPDVAQRIAVIDWAEGGKSRTMHRYIHDQSRRDVDVLGFMDADIVLPEPDTLARMLTALKQRPELQTFTSRPIKDVAFHDMPTGFVGKIIAASGGGLTDFRTAICGQLFMMRAPMARQIGLPTGLPVEDGFMRAMMLTDLLSAPEALSRIDGDMEVFHVYESIRTIPELIRHQIRIVIGSAINAVLFAKLRAEAPTQAQAHDMLMQAANTDGWLGDVLRTALPRWPHGYVPLHFLTWRVREFFKRRDFSLRRWPLLVLGFGFDAVVYVGASLRMMLRPSDGFW